MIDGQPDPSVGRHAALTHHPFFSALAADEIQQVAHHLRTVQIPPLAVFVREGEPGDCVYVLTAGSVEIIKALGTADERSFGVRGPGDTIGEMSLFDPGELRSASVRALTPVDALLITRADFDQLLAQFPHLSRHLLRSLSERLRSAENNTIRDLRQKNHELIQAYEDLKAAQQQLVEQEVLARELAQARRIQMQMLPARLPHREGIELGAAIRPARTVGGDLYEVVSLDADRVAIAIGDVSGKGVPAALYMALVSSLLRAEARQHCPPEEVVRNVNRHLCERELDGMFVTLLYCELNVAARRLRLVRAGHERPLLWAGAQRLTLPAGGRAVPLGLIDEPPLEIQDVVLAGTATLLLYTDGVTDAANASDVRFGLGQLYEAAERMLHLSPQTLCDSLLRSILLHQGNVPQFDDITLFALRVT